MKLEMLKYVKELLAATPGLVAMASSAVCKPLRSRPSSGGNNFQQFNTGPHAGGFSNFAVNINPPVHTVFLMGNDLAGAITNVYLSFVPIAVNATTGEPIVGGGGTFKAFRFVPTSSATTPLFVSFRNPIQGQVFISSFDTGQPGSVDWFLASDDLMTGVTMSNEFKGYF